MMYWWKIKIKYLTENDSGVLYYVTVDVLFEIIHMTYMAVGHVGKNKIIDKIKKIKCYVTTEAVIVYLGLCNNCLVKQSNLKRGLVTNLINPMYIPHLIQERLIDMIDIQSQISISFTK